MVVVLTPSEMIYVAAVGAARHCESVASGRRDAHGISDAAHASSRGHIREPHLPIVAIETVGVRGGALLERRRLRTIREEDVGATVAVVIEDRKSPGNTLDEILVGRG